MEKEKRKWSLCDIMLVVVEILLCAAGLVLAIVSFTVDGLKFASYGGLCIIMSSGIGKFRRRNNLSNMDMFSVILLAVSAVLFIVAILL